MAYFDIFAEKRDDAQDRADDYAADRPDYIGVDGEGDWHFWSRYDRRVIVVSDDEVETCDLKYTNEALGKWYEHTRDDRGWVDCNIDTPRRRVPA
jgi:hypothetical protein